MTLQQMALHTTVITHENLQKSPAQTLDQVLREVAGVNVSGAPFYVLDPTGQQTKMRGATNSKVLVMVDGIPIHDPFYNTTQWFKVPLSGIERVEVVRGGSSSLWGNLAVAGIVNVVTKKPTGSGGLLDVSRQSLNTTSASISKNFSIGDAFAFRLFGNVFNTDGYQTTPADQLHAFPGKGASAATNGNVQVVTYYTPSNDFSAFVRGGYNQQRELIGGYKYGKNLQKSPDAAGGFTTRFAGMSRADVRVWMQHEQFDKENGAACYLVSSSSCNTSDLTSPLVQYANSRDWNPYREVGASGTVTTAFASVPVSVQAGVDFRRVWGEDSATTYNKPTTTDITSSTINRINYGKGTQQFIGGFTQLNLAPTEKLNATLSMRYDYWTNQDGIAQLIRYTDGTPDAAQGGAIANSHKGSFNPSVSLRYAVTDRFAVRGAAYRSFRAPGLNDLYRSYSSSTFISIANPNLSPETLTGGEIGADFETRPVTVGVTAFAYHTKGLIATYKIQDTASAPAEVQAICGSSLSNCPASISFKTNGQDATSRGVEFTGTWWILPTLTVNGTYAYTDSHYTATTTNDPTGVQLGGIPKNVATFGVNWQTTSRWRNDVEVHYSGSMYLDVNQTLPQKAFTLVNASTAYQLTRQMALYGSVVNLTDKTYSDNPATSASSETLGMPRVFTGGIRVAF
jgi:iron complex outermembrane receptor protein